MKNNETTVDAFYIAENKPWPGFMMTFPNQWSVSVAWGPTHYCDEGKTTAEVAIWDDSGGWYTHNEETNTLSQHDEYSVVNERVDAVRLVKILNLIAEVVVAPELMKG